MLDETNKWELSVYEMHPNILGLWDALNHCHE